MHVLLQLIKEETTGIIGEVCANTFQILLIKPSQEGYGQGETFTQFGGPKMPGGR